MERRESAQSSAEVIVRNATQAGYHKICLARRTANICGLNVVANLGLITTVHIYFRRG